MRQGTHEGEAFHYRGRHRHPHSQGPMRTWQESRSIGEWGGSSFCSVSVSENGSHIRSPNLKNKK